MELARSRRARIRREKLIRALKMIAVGVVTGLITSSLVYWALSRNQEFISPLPEDEKCIQLNIEVNPSIEKNQNENGQSINADIEEPGTSPELRQSDNHVVTASYYTTEYCERFNPSCLTASGDVFTNEGLTAACADSFKLGTKIRLTSDNGSVTVVCNDRGSFSEKYGRTFDLTPTAFSKLASLSQGVVAVQYQVVE